MGSPLDSTFCRCVSRISVGRKVAGNDNLGETKSRMAFAFWIGSLVAWRKNGTATPPFPRTGALLLMNVIQLAESFVDEFGKANARWHSYRFAIRASLSAQWQC